jgi:hypothetical protein
MDLLFNSYFWGFVVTTILRIYFWVTKSKDYIKIGSISFSILGGKVPFRDVVYITRNASLHIIDGYVAFNWWFLFRPKWEGSESIIVAHFSGLEYVIFNNQSAYEHLEELKKKRNEEEMETEIEISFFFNFKNSESSTSKKDSRKNFFSWVKGFGIKINNGNIIIGNNKLPTCMNISFKKASGIFRLDKVNILKVLKKTLHSPLDNYRFLCEVKMEKFQYSYPKNPEVEFKKPTYEDIQEM